MPAHTVFRPTPSLPLSHAAYAWPPAIVLDADDASYDDVFQGPKLLNAGEQIRRNGRACWSHIARGGGLPVELRGHYQYYSIRGNYAALELFYIFVRRAWHYWLSRRSRESYIPWKKFERILETFPLPRPRIIHEV